ncbi:MAG: hypothetical protein ABIG44_15835 [Planctomycetota bacterium]
MRELKVTRDGQRQSVYLDDRAREVRAVRDLVDIVQDIRDLDNRFHQRVMLVPEIRRAVQERGATAKELMVAVDKLEEVWRRHRTGV